jgi:hypothetical protein
VYVVLFVCNSFCSGLDRTSIELQKNAKRNDMKSSWASVPGLRSIVRTSIASLVVILILATSVTPQDHGLLSRSGEKDTLASMALLSPALVNQLEISSLQRLIHSNAAVVLVFFSSESASLYTRLDSASTNEENSALGATLRRPLDLDALLNVTSLVPQSPAWEPLVYDPSIRRIIAFQEPARNRVSPGSTRIAWLRRSPNSESYCCVNNTASILW